MDKINNETDKYYIYWQNAEKNGKWQLIEDTPEKRKQAIKQGAAYFTTTSFKNSKGYTENKPEPIRTGNFYFDFDDKEQPENALKDMLKLVNHLQEIYSLDVYDFKYWLSGGKGFHAMIPDHVFGEMAVNGLNNLHVVYKKIAIALKTTLELNSLDLSIYNGGKGKMFRIENIKRPDNDRYKVELTFDELSLSYSEILELSTAPRTPDNIDIDCLKDISEIKENILLAELFNRTQKELIEINNIDARATATTQFTQAQKQFLTNNIPHCISHILLSQPPKNEHINFNKLLMVIVPYFQQTGKTLAEALNTCSEFLNNYQYSDTYNTAQKRITAFKSMWLYVASNANYKFNCKFVKGLHLPKSNDVLNGFDCSTCEASKPFESEKLPFCFWREETTDKEKIVLKIYERELYLFLESRGYRNTKLYDVPMLVRIVNNIVEEVTISDIRQALIKEFLPELPEQISDNFFKVQLEEMLLKRISDYISIEKLQTLQKQILNLHTDTKHSTVFFFRNGVVECSSAGVILKPYKSLNCCVWRKSIIDHDINLNSLQDSNYTQFLKNVCTQPETKTLDIDRYNALLTVHGYLLNRYNDPAYPKTVILSDGNLAEDSNGGTGKGIIALAISKMRRQALIEGKTTDFKSQFAFQKVEKNTENILIDDTRKNFDFQDFFSKTTTGYTIEKKYQQAYQFTPETNPKTLITTNFSIKGTGSSYVRRKYEFELLPYYNENFTPEQDLGGNLLQEWSKEQWSSFYNFMFTTCTAFHSAGNRILNYNSDTLELKKLQTEIGQDFIDFADTLEKDTKLKAGYIIETYKKTLSEKEKQTVSLTSFGIKLKKYCKNKGIIFKKTQETKDRILHYELKANTSNQNTAQEPDSNTSTATKTQHQNKHLQQPAKTNGNLNLHLGDINISSHSLKCKAYDNGNCYSQTQFEHKSGKPKPCNIKTCQYKERTNIHELIELEN